MNKCINTDLYICGVVKPPYPGADSSLLCNNGRALHFPPYSLTASVSMLLSWNLSSLGSASASSLLFGSSCSVPPSDVIQDRQAWILTLHTFFPHRNLKCDIAIDTFYDRRSQSLYSINLRRTDCTIQKLQALTFSCFNLSL